jgi:UDP-N-acetylglucosamine 1-carboxyvinyltransferase
LLSAEKITISNIPNIRDVIFLIQLLEGLGVEVEKLDNNTYTFCARNIDLDYMQSAEFVSKAGQIRGSVMIMGPLLARFGKAVLPKPGGDKIGRRRMDTHLNGLQFLGVDYEFVNETNIFLLKGENLKGTFILKLWRSFPK